MDDIGVIILTILSVLWAWGEKKKDEERSSKAFNDKIMDKHDKP